MTETSDDQALLAGARMYDEGALGEIYSRYSTELYRYSVRLLGDVHLAEDCVAETFSRFLQALGRGRGPQAYLRAYLYRVAHNWIVDYFRRSPPATISLDPELAASNEADPSVLVAARMDQDRLRLALLEVTPDQRQVLVLRYLEGFSNEEVAAALHKSVGAVKALQHRALAALKRRLQDREGPP
jgi:RNA polymerase sigma-70 factor (ECF subfamily)